MTDTKHYQNQANTQDLGWYEERAEFEGSHQNIGTFQRMLSAIAGIALLARGFSYQNRTGTVSTIVGGGLLYRAISGYCPAFGVMGVDMSDDNQAGRSSNTNRLGRRKVHADRATKIQKAIEINCPSNEIYRFWRALDNLPLIMSHLDSVQVIDDRLSHWVVKTMPAVPKVEWDAEIINDVENERIGWRSLKGADIDHTGSVEFKPTGDGQRTWLTVRMQYDPPGGQIGATMAKWLGADPDTKIGVDLQRFKEQMEAGLFAQAKAR